MTIADLTKHARELMHKAIESTKREFSTIRSNKASPSLLDLVRVEAYGNAMALNQVAMVAAPEPRLITVQPFDKSLTQAIEKAIREADLGLNPATQGNLIRVPLPALSQERRKELVKVVHKLAEEGRIAVRHARTGTRWVAAAVAAGVILGIVGEHVTHRITRTPYQGRSFQEPESQMATQPVRAVTVRTVSASDDEFYGQVELAFGSAAPAALRSLDALTPRASDVRE